MTTHESNDEPILKGADELSYRAVLNAVPIGIALLGENGLLGRVNERLCRMLGYSADELHGKTFADLLHPDDDGSSFESGRLEARFIHRSGAVVWTEVQVQRVSGAGKSPVTAVAIEDVTDRKRQEEMSAVLATQSRRLSSIISRSPFFTALTDADGRVHFINDAGLELLGVDAIVLAELGGMDIAEIAPVAGGGGPLIEAVRRRDSWLGECNFRQSVTGKETPMEVCAFETAESLETGEGGTAIVAYDITTRRKYQAEVQSKNRRLALLAQRLLSAQEDERAAIARELHDDITQDLSFVAMELGMLQAEDGVSEPVAKAIRESYEKIGDLAEKVRKLSHQYHPSVLNHSDLNGALRSLCSELGEMHGIEIGFETSGDVSACSNETGIVLYRIAQESLRNAIKHAGADRLVVSVVAGVDGVRVAVTDDGVGFEPGASPEAGGLGLQSMRERAETVGATTVIESEPGKGTRIIVTAPAEGRRALSAGELLSSKS